jgi:hypothetical protein
LSPLKTFHSVTAVLLPLFLAGLQAAAQTTITNCTESALRSALAQGGTVSFGCDGVITLADTLAVANDTVLVAGLANASHRGEITAPEGVDDCLGCLEPRRQKGQLPWRKADCRRRGVPDGGGPVE